MEAHERDYSDPVKFPDLNPAEDLCSCLEGVVVTAVLFKIIKLNGASNALPRSELVWTQT